MNDDVHHPASHLFTLRVWLEALGDGHSEWRGQFKYVLTGETYYFRQWDQLREMLRRCLPGFDLEPGPWFQPSAKRCFEGSETEVVNQKSKSDKGGGASAIGRNESQDLPK